MLKLNEGITFGIIRTFPNTDCHMVTYIHPLITAITLALLK